MMAYLTCFIVIYLSILGSLNQVDSLPGPVVTTDSAVSADASSSSEVIQSSSDSSSVSNSYSLPTLFLSTTPPPKTIQFVTYISTERSGKTSFTTATSSTPWRVVALSLTGVSAVLFLAFITTIIILCKMKSKLGHASKTLYPITPIPEQHEYLDLESGTKKKYKGGVKVELTNITSHEEEEFDSPTFPPTPPVKPKRSTPSSLQPSIDEAPQLPSRAKTPNSKASKGKFQTKSSSKQKLLQHDLSGSNASIGETNKAFQQGIAKDGKSNGMNTFYDDGGGDMYESYEHGYPANPVNLVDEDDDADDADVQAPYEEPVKTTGHLVQRQGSSTGLPEFAIKTVSSREQMQDAPLQEKGYEEEDEFDDEGFGTVDPDSGLPDINGMHNIDDLQFFDDPDAMADQINNKNEDAEDLHKQKRDSGDALSSTSDSMDDLLTYDDADMNLDNIDENGDGDEPGFYEYFEANDKSVLQNKIEVGIDEKREILNTDEEIVRDITSTNKVQEEDEIELPKVPPRRKSTINKNRDSQENATQNEVSAKGNGATEASSGVPDQFGFPSVPPRRDPFIKQLETDNVVKTFNEMVPEIEIPPAINMDTFPGDVAQLRPGKKVEDGNIRPRDSYFLDVMDEIPVELSENSSKNILSSDIVDMTGSAEMSNGNVHLSEVGDRDNGFE